MLLGLDKIRPFAVIEWHFSYSVQLDRDDAEVCIEADVLTPFELDDWSCQEQGCQNV